VSEKPQKQPRSNGFLRYAGMATQMAAIIGIGVWGGMRLDRMSGGSSHFWTLTLSLISVGVAMYLSIRDLTRT
jgi:ATP synthase protein I